VGLAVTGCGGGKQATFANPVVDENFPDPFVLRVGETYYAYGTNDTDGNVQTLRSRDLVHWRQGADALPTLGVWASPGRTWAPEVLALDNGGYVLYYTAAGNDEKTQCVGRAVSRAPGGPFVDKAAAPLVCQTAEGGSIDPSPFRDADGSLYLLWKNDGNCCGEDTYLYSQRLSENGLHLVGQRTRLVEQDAPWEGRLVEAPTLWRHDGRYYLFFSANAYYDGSYAVGYARCDGPAGPCSDAAENPILKTRCDAVGPGHQALVEDADGTTWMLYHAWPAASVNSEVPGRLLWLDRVAWTGGKPVVDGPTCGPQDAPQVG
jgi:beta-xylosidase